MMNYTNTTIPIQNTGVPQLNQQITFQQPSFFPQPIGNVYNLSTATDIGNVPASANLSVGLCLAENILYIKSLQGGVPMILGYKLVPLESTAGVVQKEVETDKLEDRLQRLENEIAKLKGGKLEWQV